jgi:hypothetical protein
VRRGQGVREVSRGRPHVCILTKFIAVVAGLYVLSILGGDGQLVSRSRTNFQRGERVDKKTAVLSGCTYDALCFLKVLVTSKRAKNLQTVKSSKPFFFPLQGKVAKVPKFEKWC